MNHIKHTIVVLMNSNTSTKWGTMTWMVVKLCTTFGTPVEYLSIYRFDVAAKKGVRSVHVLVYHRGLVFPGLFLSLCECIAQNKRLTVCFGQRIKVSFEWRKTTADQCGWYACLQSHRCRPLSACWPILVPTFRSAFHFPPFFLNKFFIFEL